jgi:abortive infection bacteriophage resistance protein
MEITDEDKAKACLDRIGYYRLSAYWYPYRKSEEVTDPTTGDPQRRILDDFRDGTTFLHALDFYVFDKKLRLIAMDALERIEIGLRTSIAVRLGQQDPWAHRDPTMLHGHFALQLRPKQTQTKHQDWLNRLDDKFARSREDFAKHFKEKYPSDTPPIWVAVELWDFGTLSHFFSGLKQHDKDAVAADYNVPTGNMLGTWLRNLNDVRNLCAHHSRLWNRNMASRPSWPSAGAVAELDHLDGQTHSLTRFYASAVIMRHLMKTINPTSSWKDRLVEHVGTLPDSPYVTLASGGFPNDWTSNAIWQ